jgi:succinylarginine dihydrolase
VGEAAPVKFPARQTLEASRAVARLHQLDERKTLFLRQSPAAVDAGVFHNDVVAVANENVIFFHSSAYADGVEAMRHLREACEFTVHTIEVPEERVPLVEAVETYLFNSQLVTVGEGKMDLIAPVECRERENVRTYVDELVARENPIVAAHYLDVRQSMKNGGGPACLRLRVVLTDQEMARVHRGVMLTDELYAKLVAWVEKHYREEIRSEDLRDPRLAVEARDAIEKLESILGISSFPPTSDLPARLV